MNLRRDFELWTFNIVETAIDYGIKCILYYAMARYGPHRLMCLNKPIGGQGVKCGGLNMLYPGSDNIRRCGLVGVDVALLEEVCYCGGGL